MKEGEDVGAHVNSMLCSIEELQSLDFTMNAQLQIDLILQSLSETFGQTIANFHMNKIECTLAELLNMLVMTQKAIHNEKGKEVALISYSSGTKKKKGNKSNKAKERIPKALGGVSKNKGKKKVENKGKGKCFYCKREGYWKRNCPKFLELINGKEKTEEGETFSNLIIFKCS